MDERLEIETKYNKARSSLLLVIFFTVVNVGLALFNAGISFLFSATFPLVAVEFGKVYSLEINNSSIYVIGIISALVAIFCYVVLYFLSKKYKVCLLIALVLFSLDTLFLLWILTLGFDFGVLINIAFHAWVLYYFSIGVKAWLDLKKLPLVEEQVVVEANAETLPIRPVSLKGRVIIAYRYEDLNIVVKRIFGATELVVNGMVYGEKKGIVEFPYELVVFVGGVSIMIKYDAAGLMSLFIDKKIVAKKSRLI